MRAQLLLGGLYLSLGMHNEAGERFQTLLTNDVPTGVRNRAWFYLAQVWYARGYLDKAEEALRKIQGKLSPELEAQKEHLFANVLMHEGRFDEAIRLLATGKGSPIWTAYARFNLGVALVRPGAAGGCRSVPDGRRHDVRGIDGAARAEGSRQPGAGLCLSAGEAAREGARSRWSACG